MGSHGKYDHEIYNGTDTLRFKLIRNEDGSSMYRIENFVPQYRNPLTFTQENWIGGHGQHTMAAPDMYFEGQSIDTTQDGRVFLGPLINEVKDNSSDLDNAPVVFFWYEAQSKWLCATSTNIYVYDGTDWDVASTTVTGVTAFAEYEDICYAARGKDDLYYTSANGTTWTITDLTDGYANYFCVAPNPAGTAEVLWKAKLPNEVSQTDDGTAGGTQWTTPNYIGDKSTDITNIFTHNDRLLIGKTSNLFHLASDGGVHPLRKDLETQQSSDNFKYMAYWQAGVYFSEIDGMGEITGQDAYEPMGPLTKVGTGALGDLGKYGQIKGIASDKDWLYVAIDEGTNTHIYKGREVRRGGTLRWEWCPWICLLTNTTATLATCQHTTATTERRLWFGYGTNGKTTAYVTLSDNPTDDSNADFCAAGWVRMSYDYGTDAEWDKLWQSCVIECTGLQAGETVQIKYRDDTDTSATECVATGTIGTTNGITEHNFASAINNKRVQFEIHLASNTTTATPEVSYFQAKGVEIPVTTRIHEAVYAIGDDPSRKAKTLRDFFRTARTTTTLLKFADLRYEGTTGGTAGTDYAYAVMEPGFPQEVEIIHSKGMNPELGIKVRLREVTAT